MKIKIGAIEIEYEGSEEFLKQELPALLTAVSNLHKEAGIVPPAANTNPANSNVVTPKNNVALSVTTIAAKLQAKSGTDLVMAAGMRLTRGGSGTFTRAQLLDEMKLATGFFKATYRSNLSNYLLTLVKDGKLQETGKDTYTLSSTAYSETEAKLA